MSKSLKVSFIPPGADFVRNALFEGRRDGTNAHSPNAHWFDCYAALRPMAAEHNIVMVTSDLLPPPHADVVVYMVQPAPKEIMDFKQQNRNIKTVLILLETSLGAAFTFNPLNHVDFDAVLTYRRSLVDHKKYFPMRPHAYDRSRVRNGKAYADRRVGCLVGTNRRFRLRSGFGARRSGWRFSISDWLDYAFCPGELMSYRAKLGRLCSGYPGGYFDIYGEGWEIYPETKERCLGVPQVSTLDYVGNYRFYFALENHRSRESLISERIWDALWGDTVPVYLGNPNVGGVVPKECIIDASEFSSPAELLHWLTHAPECEWRKLRQAGRDFIQSVAIEPYLPEACAKELLQPFLMLAGR